MWVIHETVVVRLGERWTRTLTLYTDRHKGHRQPNTSIPQYVSRPPLPATQPVVMVLLVFLYFVVVVLYLCRRLFKIAAHRRPSFYSHQYSTSGIERRWMPAERARQQQGKRGTRIEIRNAGCDNSSRVTLPCGLFHSHREPHLSKMSIFEFHSAEGIMRVHLQK